MQWRVGGKQFAYDLEQPKDLRAMSPASGNVSIEQPTEQPGPLLDMAIFGRIDGQKLNREAHRTPR